VYLFIGEADEGLDRVRSVYHILQSAGVACWLDQRPQIGHIFPTDQRDTLQRALDFAVSGCSPRTSPATPERITRTQ
jgi:hypothetical protein